MRKKSFLIFLITIFFFTSLYGENDEVINLRRSFIISDLKTKNIIIQSAQSNNHKKYIPLYDDAINFIQAYYDILEDDAQFLNIGKIAIKNLAKLNYKKSIQDIRYLFSTVDDEEFKIICLEALSKLLENDTGFTNYLNTLYEEGLNDLLYGKKFNINLLIAYSNALGNFANPTSFKILFKTLLYPVPEKLTQTVKKALNNIFFDYYSEISNKMKQKDTIYIAALYELAKENKKLTNEEIGKISEAVLEFGIKNLDAGTQDIEKIILKTIPVFSDLKWSAAATNVNKIFHYAQKEWKKQRFSTENLINIINCMGNLGTLETAQNLSIFLGVLNAQTERTKQYDEKLILQTIKALSQLGSKTAFDYLLFIEYLEYSSNIKIAARQAIEELKW